MLFRAYSRQSEAREKAGSGTMLLPAYSGQNDERYCGGLVARASLFFAARLSFRSAPPPFSALVYADQTFGLGQLSS